MTALDLPHSPSVAGELPGTAAGALVASLVVPFLPYWISILGKSVSKRQE